MEGSSSAATSSTSPEEDPLFVDECYLLALFDSEEVLPVSDEKYAYELHLQEALVSAVTVHNQSASTEARVQKSAVSAPRIIKTLRIQESGESSKSNDAVCLICMDLKDSDDLFANDRICSHKFCTECIATYLAIKIQENIAVVECPEVGCKGSLDPESCRSIQPQEVFARWADALCESMILGSQKVIHCPYNDCSAMLVDDSGEKLTACECPHCRRLFCAQCKVSWHSGMDCAEFDDGRGRELDLMAVKLAKENNWMRCPRCSFYVEKIDGCKHIKCRCNYEFCYGCGSKYTGAACGCV